MVNDEAITGTELKKFEMEMVRSLQAELEGEKLEQALRELKKELLNKFIEQKLLLSKVKEKNYDVDADVETIIQEIKKQNNIASDDDLKKALAGEGIEFAAWKDMWKDRRKQERLVWDEVGSKIKIDNPQIMEYYRKNTDRFTVPAEFTLNCIYLKKNDDGTRPQEKMDLDQRRAEARPFRRGGQEAFRASRCREQHRPGEIQERRVGQEPGRGGPQAEKGRVFRLDRDRQRLVHHPAGRVQPRAGSRRSRTSAKRSSRRCAKSSSRSS